jgi:hypothetical protein
MGLPQCSNDNVLATEPEIHRFKPRYNPIFCARCEGCSKMFKPRTHFILILISAHSVYWSSSFFFLPITTLSILIYLLLCERSWDSAVGITTGYGLNDQGVRVQVPVGSRIFSSHSDWLWGPPNLLPNGYRGLLSLGVKWLGEADHSPPTSAKVQKMWSIHPLPHMSSWHSAWFVKHRDNFTLLLYEEFFYLELEDPEIYTGILLFVTQPLFTLVLLFQWVTHTWCFDTGSNVAD